MKRILCIIIASVLFASSLLVLTSCDETECKHVWGEYITEPGNEATCAKDGYSIRTCEKCGEESRRIDYALSHTYSSEWSYDGNYHWHEATCGHNLKLSYGPHNFVDNLCTVCDRRIVTQGLDYKGILGTGTYLVEGIGDAVDAEVIVGNTYSGYPIVGVMAEAFAECEGLTGVYMQSNIITVGDYAFRDSKQLTAVQLYYVDTDEMNEELEEGEEPVVQTIGRGLFLGCDALANIYFVGTLEQWAELTSRCPGWDEGLRDECTIQCLDGFVER